MRVDELYIQAHHLVELGHTDLAKTNLLRVIGAVPDWPEPHVMLSQILLEEGEWRAGWREYKWCKKAAFTQNTVPPLTSMDWNGMQIEGTLLVVVDHGIGDNFMYSRFLPRAAALCNELIVACPFDMIPLIGQFGFKCYDRWADVPGHTAHVRMAHLPEVFCIQSSDMPYPPYFHADPKLVVHRGTANLRVGLCWAGNPIHPRAAKRSMPREMLDPIRQIPDIITVDLIKDKFPTWADTAAAIHNLDVVVSVDTAVAHLAGAMGKEVLLMLPKVASDYRWRDGNQWYANLSVVRQEVAGDWTTVVEEVRTEVLRRGAADYVQAFAE